MRRRVLLPALAALLVACSSDKSTAPNVFGTYALITVGGQPLPYQTPSNATITAATITLSSNQSFNASLTETGLPPGAPTTASGFWSYVGTTVSFTEPPNRQSATDGALDGTTLTLTEGTVAWVYVKQ